MISNSPASIRDDACGVVAIDVVIHTSSTMSKVDDAVSTTSRVFVLTDAFLPQLIDELRNKLVDFGIVGRKFTPKEVLDVETRVVTAMLHYVKHRELNPNDQNTYNSDTYVTVVIPNNLMSCASYVLNKHGMAMVNCVINSDTTTRVSFGVVAHLPRVVVADVV